MRLLPDRHHGPASTGAATPRTHRVGDRRATDDLLRLLERAATAQARDADAAAGIRDVARTTIAALIDGGGVPSHLAVSRDDAPVVVERTLAAASRHLDANTALPTG